MKKKFSVNVEYNNTRLDRWFRKNVLDIPQSLIEKHIRKGNIKINKKKKKSSYKLVTNDEIILHNLEFSANKNKKKTIPYKASKEERTFSSSLIIENNENFVILNKPAGIAVQSGTKSRKNIIDILRDTKEFLNYSPYVVHRIDKETTGILIVAKNRKYAQLFTSLFRIRKIHKTYLGILVGALEKNKGTFIDYLTNYEGEKKIKSKAITHYTVLDTNNKYSLVKLNPETGRKHQLRKQLLMRGCPIFGDKKYNLLNTNLVNKNTLMLHAYKINFSIADIKYNFKVKPPKIFLDLLKEKYLRIYFQ